MPSGSTAGLDVPVPHARSVFPADLSSLIERKRLRAGTATLIPETSEAIRRACSILSLTDRWLSIASAKASAVTIVHKVHQHRIQYKYHRTKKEVDSFRVLEVSGIALDDLSIMKR